MAISIIDDINSLTNLAQALGKLAPFMQWLTDLVRRRNSKDSQRPSYETVSLTIRLVICDARGRRAYLVREHKVRFLAAETGVIRDVIWGDGDTMRGYEVGGAEVVSVRREGAKQFALLALPSRPTVGQIVTVTSRRLITNGFLRKDEYLETEVESQTPSILLSVVFPTDRAPVRALAEETPPTQAARRLHVRLRADHRAHVTWRIIEPRPLATYRVRWSW